MDFHLDPLSRAFSEECGFAEKAQRLSVNRRPKHIEMYAVSKKDALVWTGSALSVLKFYKVIIFVGVLCYFWVVVKIYCRSSMFTYSLVF